MTVHLGEGGEVFLVGDCPVEDADILLQKLLEHPDVALNWSRCTSAHTAVIQVLLAAGRVPAGVPMNAFLQAMVGPALGRARNASSAFPDGPGDAK
jgi:hypothetical protein